MTEVLAFRYLEAVESSVYKLEAYPMVTEMISLRITSKAMEEVSQKMASVTGSEGTSVIALQH